MARSLRYRLTASLVTFGVVLAALEALARLVAPVAPGWSAADNPGVIMVGHETRLWGMGPGVRKNVSTTATINKLGLRGPVPRTPRPAGHERVLLVGDSSFFGHGIGDNQTIAVRLGEALQGSGVNGAGVDVDVVNGAIPGYSTEQTRVLLDEVGWALQPTLLLIANLWSDNNADGFRDADLLHTVRFYRGNPLASLALFRLASEWIDRARGGDQARIVTWTKSAGWPAAGTRRVPLQDYARNLDTMVRDARARGCGVAFIAPANQALVDAQPNPPAGWEPYFSAQAAVAKWHGLPLASATKALQADPQPTAVKFVDLMHPSAIGAADIGMEVARVLRTAGWPTERLLGREEAFDASALVDVEPEPSQPAIYSPQAQLFPGAADPTSSRQMDPDHHEPGTKAWRGE